MTQRSEIIMSATAATSAGRRLASSALSHPCRSRICNPVPGHQCECDASHGATIRHAYVFLHASSLAVSSCCLCETPSQDTCTLRVAYIRGLPARHTAGAIRYATLISTPAASMLQ
jgi:hypothetical protein